MMELPMPFIVGAGRSGTTLLRLMLDAHPDMAIPPETHFISNLDTKMAMDSFFLTVTSHPTWPDFHIDKNVFKKTLRDLNPFSVTEGLRCFYNLYKNKYGKRYVGDKTPLYSLSMTSIQTMLPEARFIHLIRDGRDVALSHRGLWFGPSDNIESAANYWSSTIQDARQQAPHLKHYLEIRFEQLILNTVDVLKSICTFLEIPFSEKMLNYHMGADRRLAEFCDRYHGSLLVKREDLISIFKLTRKEPDASRIFCWKNQMNKAEHRAFEKIAGYLLKELGYETFFTPSYLKHIKSEKNKSIKENKKAIEYFDLSVNHLYDGDYEKAEENISKYKSIINYESFPRLDKRTLSHPVLSVIIVSYIAGNKLIDCIESLLNNNTGNYEIIVVDNGGNDNVIEKLLEFKLLYVISPHNFVPSEGRNVGAYFARGEILSFLDDDAIVGRDYVKNIIDSFHKHKIIGLRGKVLPKTNHYNKEDAGLYDLGNTLKFIRYLNIEGNSAFRKKEYLKLNGMNPLLFGHEGIELSYRIEKTYAYNKILYSPEVVAYHDYVDYAGDDRCNKKMKRHEIMMLYLQSLYPQITDFIADPNYSDVGNSSNMNISFSIIMPTYNRKHCINNAVDSLLAQTYHKYEIIIVDDGSTDNTYEYLLENYGAEIENEKIRYIGLPYNRGQAYARNEGLKKARHDWIGYLDTDNRQSSNFLASYVDCIARNPASEIFYAQFIKRQSQQVIGHEFDFNELLKSNFIDMGVFVHSKRIYNKLGGFDIELSCLEDWDLIIKYTENYPPIFLKIVLLDYDDNLESLRVSNTAAFDESYKKVILNYFQRIPANKFIERYARFIKRPKQSGNFNQRYARKLNNIKEVQEKYSCRVTAPMRYVFSKFKNIISVFKSLPSIVRYCGGIINSVNKVSRILLSKGWDEAKQRILFLARDQNIMIDKIFSVSISIAKVVFCEERVFAVAMISNTGDKLWEQAVNLSYHIYRADGALLQWDGLRTPIGMPIAPGVTKNILVQVYAPERPGKYRLEWDLVVEGSYWFSQRGKSPIISYIEVAEVPVIENVEPIIVNNAEIKDLNIVIAVRTWNLIRTNRLGLFQQTIASLELAGYPHKQIIIDNGSCDGTADLIRDMGGYTLPPDASIDNAGRGMNLAIEKALLCEPDIIVFSDDDIAWHPGFLCALVKFWSCAPSNIVILSGFIEPRYAWNTAYGIVECNSVRALLTSTAPGGAWTFRARDWINIGPLIEGMNGDAWGCAVLRASGRQLCQADLALHLGADNSTWGNTLINTSNIDLDRLGLRYHQSHG